MWFRLPFLDATGEILFMPAGTLEDSAEIKPEANIFGGEKVAWCNHSMAAPKQNGFKNIYQENTC
jgi:hypothetical protein|tara:strand:- start:501 stop:695 length:195 start_codon:yes stop_codon:yes gene_type:complete